MQLHARLIHSEEGRRVALVWAMEGERSLGSALGEAGTAEEAEDRATARLLERLQRQGGSRGPAHPGGERSIPPPTRGPGQPIPPPAAEEPLPPAVPPEAPAPPAPQEPTPPQTRTTAPSEPENPPDDWSSELAALDLQLQRLGWDRDQEGVYLQRAFGHPSRHRLTVYRDLVAYLRSLENLEPGSDPARAPVPLRRGDLLQQSDALLERLGWSAERGREFLQGQLGVTTRQQLSDEQLLRFNMLLESELFGGTD